MNLLGIDYGTVNTGFALGKNGYTDTLKSKRTKDTSTLIKHIKNIVERERIDKIILGIPITENNQRQKSIILEFKDKLENQLNVDIELVDESFTSKDILQREFTKHSKLKKLKKNIHSKAAEEIIKKYWRKVNPED